MKRFILAGAASLMMLFAVVSLPAQHTLGAKFDLKKPLTLSRTVTQIDWANPYVHILMKVPGQPLPPRVARDRAPLLQRSGALAPSTCFGRQLASVKA